MIITCQSIVLREKMMIGIVKVKWVICPECGGNTRTKVREDTVLYHQPVFCPKCKKEYLVNAKQFKIQVVKEPDGRK